LLNCATLPIGIRLRTPRVSIFKWKTKRLLVDDAQSSTPLHRLIVNLDRFFVLETSTPSIDLQLDLIMSNFFQLMQKKAQSNDRAAIGSPNQPWVEK
jgi:hypothetical protein